MKRPIELSPSQLEIYLLLKEHKNTGVMSWDITNPKPQGLQILEYTGRISDLRKDGYEVVNVEKNKYVLMREPQMGIKDVTFILHQAQIRGYKNLVARCRQWLSNTEYKHQVIDSLTN